MQNNDYPRNVLRVVSIAALLAIAGSLSSCSSDEPTNTAPDASPVSAAADSSSDPTRERRANTNRAAPVDTTAGPNFTAWRPGAGLDAVLVNDMLVASDGGVWLATGLGLAHMDASGEVRSHRYQENAADEWARHLVQLEDRIALTAMWPSGASGGNRGATLLFDEATGNFQNIGRFSRALVGHKGQLYGAREERLVRYFENDEGTWMTERVKPEVDVCRVLDIADVDDVIWLAHYGEFRRRSAEDGDKPCGATRLVPNAEGRMYTDEHGMISGFGRAVAGDAAAVYVAHGDKADGVSVFEPQSREWSTLNGKDGFALRANVLGASPDTVWLGTPDQEMPLVRLDRTTGAAQAVAGVPEGYTVSAIAGDADGAWVAWSKKEAEGEGFAVTTWVARVQIN